MHPATPVDRCLCRYRTGAGKTRNMISLLDNYFEDPRAKFVLCPNTEVVSNFYSELLTYDSAYKGYVFNKLKEKRWARKTKTFKQFHKTVFAQFNCTRPGCGNVVHDDIMCRKCGKLHKLTLEEVKDILSLKGTILSAGQKGLMAGPLRCYRINEAARKDILVRKNHPMINHNRRRFGEPSSPYDNSIVIIDEVHNLFLKNSDQNQNHKRDLLVKALTKASNLVLCGLTATPISNHKYMDQQYNKLMTFIKGTDGKNKSNAEGYIFNFNALLPTLFPRVIPKLGFDGEINQFIIGEMVFVTLSQAHADLYAKKHRQIFGDDVKSVNQLSLSKTKWLMNYANTTSYWTKGGLPTCRDNLRKDPYTHMAKFKQIVEDVSKRPQEKTLIILPKQANFLCMIEAFAYLFRQKNIKVVAFNRACEVMGFATNSDSIKYWTKRQTCKESEEYNNMKDAFNSFNPTKERGYGFDNQISKNRVMIVESTSFSEGVSFFGVRRIILVNPPLDLKTYEQQIGRALRACRSHHLNLPKDQRTVNIDIYCSSLPTQGSIEGGKQAVEKNQKKRNKTPNKRTYSKKKKKTTTSARKKKRASPKKKKKTIRYPSKTIDEMLVGRLIVQAGKAHEFEEANFVQASIDGRYYQATSQAKSKKVDNVALNLNQTTFSLKKNPDANLSWLNRLFKRVDS
jgi:hypothetical protein